MFYKNKITSEEWEDDEQPVCEYCDGTGEQDEMESDGEGHEAPTGTRKCLCQLSDDEEDTRDR